MTLMTWSERGIGSPGGPCGGWTNVMDLKNRASSQQSGHWHGSTSDLKSENGFVVRETVEMLSAG